MQTSLAESQWHAVVDGTVTSPGGVVFSRQSSRVKRKAVDERVAGGVPVVVYDFGAGRLDWCDGEDAVAAWKGMRHAMTSEVPQPRGDVVWTAGVWRSGDESVLVFTGHC